MRIGILKADSVREEFQAEHGDYPQMFIDVLRRAASTTADALSFEVFDVLAGDYPTDLGSCEGYVITGSRESVYDDRDWIRRFGDFIRVLDESRTRTVGVCFGHQLIAHALGGETRPSSGGWGVGVHEFTVDANAVHGGWMTPATSFRLLCSHKDQVVRLPKGARLLASSEFCPIAAFTLGEHFVTFQGHPEFTRPYAETLLRTREIVVGERFAPAIESMDEPTDEVLVARWMLDFIRG